MSSATAGLLPVPCVCILLYAECKTEEDKRELRKKAEEYLARAEQLKQQTNDGEGELDGVLCSCGVLKK